MIALHVPGAGVSVIVQYENEEYYTRPGRKIVKLAEREYTHVDHPGRVWNRMSITVHDDEDVPRVMPVELLEIETAE
jgi:hypothetical protein